VEHQIKNIEGGKVQITITLTPEEKTKFELRALRQAGSELDIKGFRPGHIPDDVIKKQLDPAALDQETMWEAVKEHYPKLVAEMNLAVVGQPTLALQSAEPFVIHSTVSKLPEVDLGKWEKVKIKRQEIKVDEAEVNKVIEQIRDGRVSEVAVIRPAKLGDRVEIDFEVSLGGVAMDGGKQVKYPVILGAGQLVPGFEDNLVGLNSGEEKKFELTFPSSYRSDLAGKKAQVWVKLSQVFERTLPELTDDFVKSLGKFAGTQDFQDKLRENLQEEKNIQEEQRLEREMLEAIVVQAKFGDIPEVLLINEAETMLHELKHGITERGVEWSQYLQSIQKDEEGLKKEFSTPATRRVKVALIVRTFANQENLATDEMAVEQEIVHSLEHYGGDERMTTQLNSDDYRSYVQQVLTNRRVIEWLKKKLVE